MDFFGNFPPPRSNAATCQAFRCGDGGCGVGIGAALVTCQRRREAEKRDDGGQPPPRCSMYGIFTYIWLIFMVNVGKYTIHGASGPWKSGWWLF